MKLPTIILTTIVSILFASALSAEIVYTKDGQVIKGNIIKENRWQVYVKTKYRTQVIRRNNIKRILYGDREMEKISIIMQDGSSYSGYLIDQDSKNVYIRLQKDSAKETRISKKDIKQMSSFQLIPFSPDLSARLGLFFPLNSAGADLKMAPAYFLNFGFNLPWLKNLRASIEAGFIHSEGKGIDKPYLRLFPISAVLSYNIPVSVLTLSPRLGGGVSVIEFDDGDGTVSRGADGSVLAGFSLSYELLKRTLSISVSCDYFLLIEGSDYLNTVIPSFAVSYHF